MLSHILVPEAQLRRELPLRLSIVTIGDTPLPFFEAVP